MATIPAIKTRVRRELLRAIKEDIVYVVQDGDTGDNLEPEAITLQKTSKKSRQGESQDPLLDFPGLALCSPRRITVPPEGGTDARDDWTYEFLIQLLDRDLWDDENRLATWEKWIEQLASLFNHNMPMMSAVIDDADTGATTQSIVAMSVAEIDEAQWVRHSNYIAGVQLMIVIRQPRGVIA